MICENDYIYSSTLLGLAALQKTKPVLHTCTKCSGFQLCLQLITFCIVTNLLELIGVRFYPEKFFEPCSVEKKFLDLLGGAGGMLPQKILKIKSSRLAEIGFPGIGLVEMGFPDREVIKIYYLT